MSNQEEVEKFISIHRPIINKRLENLLSIDEVEGIHDSITITAAQYTVLGEGHRFRPLLTLAAYKTIKPGGDVSLALDSGCGIEMIHAASLIFDDIMDKSTLRRGNPSTYVKFGVENAQLAGIYLISKAFDLFSSKTYASHSFNNLVHQTIFSMVYGQERDVNVTIRNKRSLLKTHYLKSGRLIELSGEAGYYAARVNNPVALDQLKNSCRALALAYKIMDDITDVVISSDISGKPSGQDAGKYTAINAWGLHGAKRKAHSFFKQAKESIHSLPNNVLFRGFIDYLSQPTEHHRINYPLSSTASSSSSSKGA